MKHHTAKKIFCEEETTKITNKTNLGDTLDHVFNVGADSANASTLSAITEVDVALEGTAVVGKGHFEVEMAERTGQGATGALDGDALVGDSDGDCEKWGKR